MESNQTLVIDGNLFVDEGGDPIVPTTGAFNVLVKSVVPVQAQGISTSGGGGATAQDIWNYLLSNPPVGSAGAKLAGLLSTSNFLALKD